jgi:hypothetical protein
VKYKWVIVEWEDITHHTGWRDMAGSRTKAVPSLCRSIGAVIRKDDKQLSIVQTLSENDPHGDDVLGILAIPIGCVRKITVLKGIK